MSTKKVIEIAKELYESCRCCSVEGVLNAINKLQEYMIGDEKDIDLQFMTKITHPMGTIMDVNVMIPTRVCSTYEFGFRAVKSFEGKVHLRANIQKAGSVNTSEFHSYTLYTSSDFEQVIVFLKHLYEKENLWIN